jgi:hypothetical protein
MPVNTLNNKKTEAIKISLDRFLTRLKEFKIRMERSGPYIFQGQVYTHKNEIIATNEGIHRLENIQFESVDEFDSVRKIRETELWFSKNDVLMDFKFPDYKSQINPTFLTYVDIEIQLDALFKKSEDLLRRHCNSAAGEAKYLIFDLRSLNRWYFEEKKINEDEYKSRALTIINEARPVLEQHRGFKQLLGNLVLLILTLGTAFIINKAVNGQFLFFQKTDSAQKLDDLTQTVSQLSLA